MIPWTHSSRSYLIDRTKELSRVTLGLRTFGASGPMKAGIILREKRAFPLGLFPGFPRMQCIRDGRFQRPGQKLYDDLRRYSALSGSLSGSEREYPVVPLLLFFILANLDLRTQIV